MTRDQSLKRPMLLMIPVLIGLSMEIEALPAAFSGGNSPRLISFQTLLSRAIRRNPKIKSLQEERMILSLREGLTPLYFLPRIQTAVENESTVRFGRTDNYHNLLELRIQQPLFLGGELKNNLSLYSFENLRMDRNEEELYQNIVISTLDVVLEYYLLREQKRLITYLLERAEFLQSLGEEEYLLGEITTTEREELVLKKEEVQLQHLEFMAQERKLRRKSTTLFGVDITGEKYFPLPPTISRDYRGSIHQILKSIRLPFLMDMVRREGPLYRKTRLAIEMERTQIENTSRLSPPQVFLTAGFFASGDRLPLDRPGFDMGVSLVWNLPHSTIEGTIQIGKSSPLIRERKVSLATMTALDPKRILSRRREESRLLETNRQLKDMDESTHNTLEDLLEDWDHRKTRIDLTRREADLYLHKKDLLEKRINMGEGTKKEYMTAEIQWSSKEIELFRRIKEMLLFEMSFLLFLGKNPNLFLENTIFAKERVE